MAVKTKTILLVMLLLTGCVKQRTLTIYIHSSKSSLMPFPIAAAITAGAALAGGALNAGATANLNRKNRRWSEEMYQRQRADAISFWNQQNDYNSPQAQMKRFQEAGLNPNLIYGQGNAGNAGAIPVPDTQRPETHAPDWGSGLAAAGSAGIETYYNLETRKLSNDNLKEQNTVLKQDALLKEAQTLNTLQQTATDKWKLYFEQRMEEISAQARQENVRSLKTATDIAMNRDAREAAQNATSLQEAAERMMSLRLGRAKTEAEISNIKAQNAQIRATIDNLRKDGTLKDLEIKLREDGINPNDPMYARILGQALDGMLKNPDGFQDKLKNFKNNLWNSIFSW